jgi:hypothetical protein
MDDTEMPRTPHHNARRAPLRRLAIIAAIAGCALSVAPGALAQPDASPGDTFAGLVLPAPLQRADIALDAAAGNAWRAGPVQRLYLEGEVRVTIGDHRFVAERAACWFEPVQREGGAGVVEPLWQVALYLENVSDPAADATVAQSADRLLVTAVISGEIKAAPAVFREGRPTDPVPAAFLAQAESRLARYLALVAAGQAESTDPAGPQIVASERLEPLPTPERIDPASVLPGAIQPGPIFAENGVITFFGPDRTLVSGDTESSLVITGGVVVQYSEPSTGRSLQLTAESAVVFLDPGSVREILTFGVEQIRGIYLEGGVVATDGQYTIRGPRFYYDLRTDRGVALDAVFWTYDEQRGLPLYLRADVIRQESESQWSAGGARLSNTSFFEPHYTLGARTVTLRRVEHPDKPDDFRVDARGVQYRIGKVPVVQFPRFQGQVTGRRVPQFSVSGRNGDPIVFTRWDIATLLGLDPVDGLDADLLLDGYVDRGVAIGADIAWQGQNSDASLFGTYINDDGTDQLSSGAEIERDNEDRGVILGEARQRLNDRWTLFAEGAYISDAAFLDAFFGDLTERRREFTNSAYLRRLEGQSLLSFEVRGPSNDFVANEYLLQSRGYQVSRLPEAAFNLVGADIAGGLLTYTTETRLGGVSLNFSEARAEEIGLDTIERAEAGLGLLPGESPADRLAAQGLNEDSAFRADTRHEISMPLSAGPVRIEPFAIGRATAYDTDFSELRTDGNDDTARLWGAGGVRIGTTLQRVNNSVSNRLLDLDRMRHIIEPSVTVMGAATTLDLGETPVYDERIENNLNGTVVRTGLKSTWQTKRGAGAAERSVDWLTLDANYVWSSDETPQRSPIGRWYESRPELSTGGEFGTLDGAMRLTDAVSLTGDWVFDFEDDSTDTFAAGILTDHGDAFATYIEYREVDAIDASFIHAGAAYELTKRYSLAASAAWDLDEDEFQTIRASLLRRFNQMTAEIGVDYDEIRDDTSFSFTLRPVGVRRDERNRLLFNRDRDALDLRSTPTIPTNRVGSPLGPS